MAGRAGRCSCGCGCEGAGLFKARSTSPLLLQSLIRTAASSAKLVPPLPSPPQALLHRFEPRELLAPPRSGSLALEAPPLGCERLAGGAGAGSGGAVALRARSFTLGQLGGSGMGGVGGGEEPPLLTAREGGDCR